MDAGLDHSPLEPFIEGGDGDPLRLAGHGRGPTGAIGGTIFTRNSVGSFTSRYFGIVIAGLYASRPDFLGVVYAIVGIDFATKLLVYSRHIAMQKAPIARAEEMNAKLKIESEKGIGTNVELIFKA